MFFAVFLHQDFETKSPLNAFKSFFVPLCGKKLLAWGQPGVAAGTFRTRSENHTPRPLSQESQELCHNIRASPVIASFIAYFPRLGLYVL